MIFLILIILEILLLKVQSLETVKSFYLLIESFLTNVKRIFRQIVNAIIKKKQNTLKILMISKKVNMLFTLFTV